MTCGVNVFIVVFVFCILYFSFYWAGFTVAQRERAQEDFNVPLRRCPTSPTLLFSLFYWILPMFILSALIQKQEQRVVLDGSKIILIVLL